MKYLLKSQLANQGRTNALSRTSENAAENQFLDLTTKIRDISGNTEDINAMSSSSWSLRTGESFHDVVVKIEIDWIM